MKNKFRTLIYFLLIFFLNVVQISAQQFKYLSDEIRILDNGNTIIGKNNIEIEIDKNISISANLFEYSNNLKKLIISGNVVFKDKLNNINSSSEKIIYYEDLGIIEIIGNVNLVDNINKVNLSSSKVTFYKKSNLFQFSDNIFFNDKLNKITGDGEEVFYSKKLNTIYSEKKSKIIYDNLYFIDLEEFNYDIKTKKISSKKLTKINDVFQNYFEVNGFVFNPNKNSIIGKKIKFVDQDENKYYLNDVMIDTSNKNLLGRDLKIKFNNSSFNNDENDPRISAKSIKIKNKKSFLKKGVFTTCSDDHECPPWSVYAEEIEHDKNEKIIKYKNAWLKIYDIPALYFPKFSHPDPSVDRKSGFLTPKFSSSRNIGSSVDIPYFYIISDNKDMTFKPKLFLNDEAVFQSEYRQENKSSSHIADFSLYRTNFFSSQNTTKMHFFSNSKFSLKNNFFEKSNVNLNFQKVNNDHYLKTYNIENKKLITDDDLLYSYIEFEGDKKDLKFNTSFEVYEDLNKDKSSRFEFIYPKYYLEKNLSTENGNDISFEFYGSQRQYNTNVYEGLFINDLVYKSKINYSKKGFVTNLNTLIKNVNVDDNNSEKNKHKFDQSLSTIFMYNIKFPLSKENFTFTENLTPKISFMFSPNETKNLSNNDLRVDASKIFSFNRIANNETVEGGGSITDGLSYNKRNKTEKIF